MKKIIDENIKIVKSHYDTDASIEWERLERHPFEFVITTKMMDQYIRFGDSILDIGGGPGRYSLYYAKKGCDVTLVDLSSANIEFAQHMAIQEQVDYKCLEGNALDIDELVDEKYDHVFLMGPMYHLLDEQDRISAINKAISLLKPNGKIYISFIMMFAGMIYFMKYCPEVILHESEKPFLDAVITDSSYGGDAFTKAYFISPKEVLPFMEQFDLEKLHMFGQEGVFSPCEDNFLKQPKEVIDKWLEVTLKIIERHELFGLSEHLMYIGQLSIK